MPPQPRPEQRRPRGPRRFGYTYDDIAHLAGWTRDQVMRTARAGVFNPENVRSVFDFISSVHVGGMKPTAPRYGKRATKENVTP